MQRPANDVGDPEGRRTEDRNIGDQQISLIRRCSDDPLIDQNYGTVTFVVDMKFVPAAVQALMSSR